MSKNYICLLFLILIIFLSFSCINFKEGYEDINQNVNDIPKNINKIKIPSNFKPTHPWSKQKKSGLKLLDNPSEEYLYNKDKDYENEMNDNLSQFATSFSCRPSITGVFTDCGPYSFNACGSLSSQNRENHKHHNHHNHHNHHKHRHHRNHNHEKKNHNNDLNIQTNCKTCNFYNYNYINNNNNKKLSGKH